MGPWDRPFFGRNDYFCCTVVLHTKLWDHGTGLFREEWLFLVYCSTTYKAMGLWDRLFLVGMIFWCSVVLHTKLWDHGTGRFLGEWLFLFYISTMYKTMGPRDRHFLCINHFFSFNVLLQSHGTMGPAFFGVNDFLCSTVLLCTKLWDHGTGTFLGTSFFAEL
jgi:hypothetical protein